MLKLEIGGDGNSATGRSRPSSTPRVASTVARASRFWLAEEQARALNPTIKLYGLQWSAPGWVTDGAGGLWSPQDVDYVIAWLKCARSDGLPIRVRRRVERAL